jgi:hypothetical protein
MREATEQNVAGQSLVAGIFSDGLMLLIRQHILQGLGRS